MLHFGQENKNDIQSADFSLASKELFISPKFTTGDQHNDVCLIKTQESISTVAMNTCGMNKLCVSQACLPQASSMHGSECWVSGWSHSGKRVSSGVNVLSKQSCKNPTKLVKSHLTKDEICVAIVDDNPLEPALCTAHAGGPLICNVDGKVTMSAIFSRTTSANCMASGNIGIFTDLYFAKNWIGLTIGENK